MTNPECWNSGCHKLGQLGSKGSLQFEIFQTNNRELDPIDLPSANTRSRKVQTVNTAQRCKIPKYDPANQEVSQPCEDKGFLRRVSNRNCREENQSEPSEVLVQSTFLFLLHALCLNLRDLDLKSSLKTPKSTVRFHGKSRDHLRTRRPANAFIWGRGYDVA